MDFKKMFKHFKRFGLCSVYPHDEDMSKIIYSLANDYYWELVCPFNKRYSNSYYDIWYNIYTHEFAKVWRKNDYPCFAADIYHYDKDGRCTQIENFSPRKSVANAYLDRVEEGDFSEYQEIWKILADHSSKLRKKGSLEGCMYLHGDKINKYSEELNSLFREIMNLPNGTIEYSCHFTENTILLYDNRIKKWYLINTEPSFLLCPFSVCLSVLGNKHTEKEYKNEIPSLKTFADFLLWLDKLTYHKPKVYYYEIKEREQEEKEKKKRKNIRKLIRRFSHRNKVTK